MPNSRPSWSPQALGRLRRVYLFVVTSLAVSVFGLIFLLRPPTPLVQVSAGIEQELTGRSEKQLMDEVRRWIADDANLQRSVEAVSFEYREVEPRARLDQARRAIKVKRALSDSSDTQAFAIYCVIGDSGVDSASDAVALVNHLAQEYVDDQLVRGLISAEENERAASKSCELASERYFAANDRLRTFEKVIAPRRAPRAPMPRHDVPAPKPTVETVEPSPQFSANPAWAEVQTDLEHLRGQRRALLFRLTEAHPRINVLDDEIGQVKRRLKATPRYIAADAPRGVKPTGELDDPQRPGRPDPTTIPQVVDRQELRRIAQEAARLQKELDVAGVAYSTAQNESQDAHDALQRFHQTVPVRITVLATASEPVESSSAGALAVLSCFALVLGGGVCVKGVRVDRTLRTKDDVEHALSLPVVGMLALDHSADAKPPVAAPPGWTRRLSRGAELFLSVFALVLMGLAVTDSSFASQCWSDPVRAPSNAVHQAVHALSAIPAEPGTTRSHE